MSGVREGSGNKECEQRKNRLVNSRVEGSGITGHDHFKGGQQAGLGLSQGGLDRGAWKTTVYRVAKSWTRLK